MMPDATIVKITMKSIFAALVSSSQHNPTHKSRMQMNLMRFPVVIDASLYCCPICKDKYIFNNNHQ